MTHNITASAPITRRLHGLTSTVIVLRCSACPKWKAEVHDTAHIFAVKRQHLREAAS